MHTPIFNIVEPNPIIGSGVLIMANPAMTKVLCDYVENQLQRNPRSVPKEMVSLSKRLRWHFAQRAMAKQEQLDTGGDDYTDDVRESYDS